jgi:CheY-like chemotaxis protein
MNKRILYVEDELEEVPEENEVWYSLVEHGYEVVPARNGQDAVYYLTNEKFDLILLDVMLPPYEENGPIGADLANVKRMEMGAHLLRKLRSGSFEGGGTFAQVPVVVVSAVPGVELWKELKHLVRNERWCLTKPCSPMDVLTAVDEALRVGIARGEP